MDFFSHNADNGMRFGVKGLQMAKQRFYNPQTDKVVVFQSAIHVADKSFYDKVLTDMRLFNGEVHLEGIRNAEEYPKMKSLHELYGVAKEFVGDLETQTARFPQLIKDKPEKYKNYDVDASEIAESFETGKMNEIFEQIKKVDLTKLENSTKKKTLNISPLISMLLMYSTKSKKGSLLDDKKIVDERNKYAVNKVLESEAKNIYMFWGAMHYSGVKELLDYNGFNHIHTSYITALKNRVSISKYNKNAVVEHFTRMKVLLNSDSLRNDIRVDE